MEETFANNDPRSSPSDPETMRLDKFCCSHLQGYLERMKLDNSYCQNTVVAVLRAPCAISKLCAHQEGFARSIRLGGYRPQTLVLAGGSAPTTASPQPFRKFYGCLAFWDFVFFDIVGRFLEVIAGWLCPSCPSFFRATRVVPVYICFQASLVQHESPNE